jgi:hypothetical protein
VRGFPRVCKFLSEVTKYPKNLLVVHNSIWYVTFTTNSFPHTDESRYPDPNCRCEDAEGGRGNLKIMMEIKVSRKVISLPVFS